MNNNSGFDMGALLALIREMESQSGGAGGGRGSPQMIRDLQNMGARIGNVQPNPNEEMKNLFSSNWRDARPIQDNERSRFGIDPRDPNQFSVMPDGSLVQTLIGWSGNGGMPNLDAIAGKPGSMKLPQMGVPGGIPQNAIPRAKPNQFGMTRVSPGMYKDKDGKMVRSTTGAPARTRGAAKTNTKG